MKKLQNEYLSLAIGTSVSTFGNVNTPFVKAFLMGHIIGKSGRDITESEMEFINSIKLVDYDLQSEGEEEDENEMVLNFDELNKLDQFEQADIVWSIIEKLGFKDATMEPNDSGYSIELECEELDETEQIEKALISIEKANFPNVNFDEFGASEKYDGLYYSRGIGEVDGEEVDVTIYYDPATEEVRISIEELEEENK